MTIRMMGSRVLVEQAKVETVSKGGIVLASKEQEKPKRGTVMAVGPGRVRADGVRVEIQVKPGDEVIFATWAGTPIKDGDREYLIMDEADILAVLDKEETCAGDATGRQ